MEEVARLSDTLALMRDGAIVRSGRLADVLADPAVGAIIGPAAAGAVLDGRIGATDRGVTDVATAAGTLRLAGIDGPLGVAVRIRVLASDVVLAVEEPRGLSALNVLPAVVEAVHGGEGPGAMVRLRAGDAAILARVTRVSADALGLVPGCAVWAVIKATGVSRADVGAG